jgi:hypothetical protein
MYMYMYICMYACMYIYRQRGSAAYVSICRSAYTENEIPIIRQRILHTSAYADYIRQRMPMPARQRCAAETAAGRPPYVSV